MAMAVAKTILLHDLEHTFAGHQVMKGTNLTTVSKFHDIYDDEVCSSFH
jgi:hypothetical protein